ncbi:hypothetical protein RhiTH_009045 [Rhizoctonia solani]
MGKFFDVIPDNLIPWIQEQRCFWVATAPLSANGHINISPKGVLGTFKIIDNKTFFWQDLTGSGQVHELGSPRYNELIPPEERIVGSRAAVVVNVHKVGSSCGYSVPLYEPAGERTLLQRIAAPLEEADRYFANNRGGSKEFEATSTLSHFDFIPSESDPSKDDHTPKGIKDYWSKHNIRSIDGLPAMVYSRKLAGLPPEAVEEDQKLFHQDISHRNFAIKLADKACQIAEVIGGPGLIVGIAIGFTLSRSWTGVYR